MSLPVRLDLHVHSRFSPDSWLELETIAARIAKLGLDGFALTDHNTVAGHRSLEALREKFPRLVIVPGVEVSTREGHLLAYGVAEAPPPHCSVDETIRWVRERGGEPVLAHPFRRAHGVGRPVAERADVHAIEARNGHNTEVVNVLAQGVASQRGLGATGGSDGHSLGDLGRAFTEFPGPVASSEDVLRWLRAKRTAAGGRSITGTERTALALRTALLRLARGFRPI